FGVPAPTSVQGSVWVTLRPAAKRWTFRASAELITLLQSTSPFLNVSVQVALPTAMRAPLIAFGGYVAFVESTWAAEVRNRLYKPAGAVFLTVIVVRASTPSPDSPVADPVSAAVAEKLPSVS